MPELPDVEGFRRYLAEHAKGQRIERVTAPDAAVLRNTTPQGLGRAVKHRFFGRPERHGKWLLARTHDRPPARASDPSESGRSERGPTIVLHFGMTGYLRWSPHEEPRHAHDRVVFVCGDGELRVNMLRKLGGVWLASGEDEVAEITGPLGPDAWQLSLGDLEDLLADRGGGIKSALMDQELVAGIGNIVADEVLWHARLHPRQKVPELDDDGLDRLHDAVRHVLEVSIDHGQVPRKDDWLTHARDVDAPRCPRCDRPVETGEVNSRTTYWCPDCQPAPR